MKKRIAFLLIVPLLCVLAASLNISYMPTGGLLFISSCTLDGESFTIRQKTMPDGTKIAVYDGETSIVYAKYRGLPHTLEDDLFRAPTIIEDGYTAEEIEFSILE